MPPVRLTRNEFAPIEQDEDGNTFVDVPVPVSKSALLRGAQAVTVVEGDTLWSIAWAAYQKLQDPEQDLRPTSFYDVIAEANDIVDVLAPLKVGSTIFVPTPEVIFGEVRVPPPFYRRNTVT